jgi:hypothetical protein
LYAPYATPLRIDLQASRLAALWLLALHVAGVAVLLFASVPAWVQATGALAVAASLWWHWSRHVSRRRSAIVRFVWRCGSDCEVVHSEGQALACTLAPRAFVMPWLVLLYFHTGTWPRSLFILPDMLPADSFRRLRVRLKTELGQQRPQTRARGRTS